MDRIQTKGILILTTFVVSLGFCWEGNAGGGSFRIAVDSLGRRAQRGLEECRRQVVEREDRASTLWEPYQDYLDAHPDLFDEVDECWRQVSDLGKRLGSCPPEPEPVNPESKYGTESTTGEFISGSPYPRPWEDLPESGSDGDPCSLAAPGSFIRNACELSECQARLRSAQEEVKLLEGFPPPKQYWQADVRKGLDDCRQDRVHLKSLLARCETNQR